ncbi:MAG: serine hydrolase domain-containing protein [Glycocaulis sp.]
MRPFALALMTACALTALTATARAHSSQEPGPPALDEAALSALIAAYDVPGAVAVELTACEPGAVVTAGYGVIETGERVGPDTVFEAASLSKPVFAYLVLTLVDEGVIDLDEKLAATFDYPRIADKAAYGLITPRMVLTHRTGLPNWVDEATPFGERTAQIDFLAQPGEAYTYSGEAFQLLQAFVEDRTGQSLQALFAQRLGALMPRSAFSRPLPGEVRESRGYHRASAPDTGRPMSNVHGHPMAAGSLASTAEDYARFLSLACRGEGLSERLHADMITPQADAPEEGAPFAMAYGLGWIIADMGGDAFIGHGGNNGAYRAFGGYLAGSGDGLVVLTNGHSGQALIDALIAP